MAATIKRQFRVKNQGAADHREGDRQKITNQPGRPAESGEKGQDVAGRDGAGDKDEVSPGKPLVCRWPNPSIEIALSHGKISGLIPSS